MKTVDSNVALNLESIKKEDFGNITQCIMWLLFNHPEMEHKRVADLTKALFDSSTALGNVKFYTNALRKGVYKFEDYLDSDGNILESVRKKFEAKVPTITDEDVARSEGLQKLGLKFAKDNDERTYSMLYSKLKPMLTRYAMGYMKDSMEADDVVSTSLINIYYRINQYNKTWNFSTWAYKIVWNECLLRLKKGKRSVSLTPHDSSFSVEGNLLYNGADADDVFDTENDDNIKEEIDSIADKVLLDIQDLPKTYRDIIIDREVNDLSYTQLAEKYDIPLGTVKTNIRRARELLIKKNKSYLKLMRSKDK